jgi:hypothetical protein
LEILEDAGQKFDFSSALKDEFIERTVYFSDSVGVKNWRYPPEKDISWSNSLTAIEK